MVNAVGKCKNVDLGKERILEELIESLMVGGIDLKVLAISWSYDSLYNNWVLTIRRGKEQLTMSFTECDVVGWPDYPAIAAKYGSLISATVAKLTSTSRAPGAASVQARRVGTVSG
jgi:hypothetical protein